MNRLISSFSSAAACHVPTQRAISTLEVDIYAAPDETNKREAVDATVSGFCLCSLCDNRLNACGTYSLVVDNDITRACRGKEEENDG